MIRFRGSGDALKSYIICAVATSLLSQLLTHSPHSQQSPEMQGTG